MLYIFCNNFDTITLKDYMESISEIEKRKDIIQKIQQN